MATIAVTIISIMLPAPDGREGPVHALEHVFPYAAYSNRYCDNPLNRRPAIYEFEETSNCTVCTAPYICIPCISPFVNINKMHYIKHLTCISTHVRLWV